MSYNFLENNNATKYLLKIVENTIELFLLFYVGLHNYTPIAALLLGICIGIILFIYGLGVVVMIFANENVYVESAKKQKASTIGEHLISGIIGGVLIIWFIFTGMGILKYNSLILLLFILGTLILPMLTMIIKELKARSFGYVSYAELLLLSNHNYGDYKRGEEYRNIREDLLTVTSVKENPKVFRKLASQYESYIQGYYD